MIWVLLAALAGGVSVLFQAQSARAEDHDGGLGLLATLLRRPRYLVGMACAGLGFVFGALALRELPLFAVQAGRAVGITLDEQIFVERGEIASRDDSVPLVSTSFRANLFCQATTAMTCSLETPGKD